MIRVTGGCALEKMREGARRSRATRNRTYFLIQTLMNPSLAPLRAVRRALDVGAEAHPQRAAGAHEAARHEGHHAIGHRHGRINLERVPTLPGRARGRRGAPRARLPRRRSPRPPRARGVWPTTSRRPRARVRPLSSRSAAAAAAPSQKRPLQLVGAALFALRCRNRFVRWAREGIVRSPPRSVASRSGAKTCDHT